jgi:hypothetical protein
MMPQSPSKLREMGTLILLRPKQDCVQVRVYGVGKAGLEITQHLINMLKVL